MSNSLAKNGYINQALLLILGALIYVNLSKHVYINTPFMILIVIYPLGLRYGWINLYNKTKEFFLNVHTGRMLRKGINRGHLMGHLTGLVVFMTMSFILCGFYWVIGIKDALIHTYSSV